MFDQIAQLFGEECAAYVRNKNRGGLNNDKGTRYEDLYAAHAIARLADELITNQTDCYVESQVQQFIDDFVVETGQSTEAYQLKNTQTLTWGDGAKSIHDDCLNQIRLSAHLGFERIAVAVVSSNNEVVEALSRTVPADIEPYARVEFFPWTANRQAWCQMWPGFGEPFARLAANDAPTLDQVANVVGIMISAWTADDQKRLVSEVINKARETSPTIIRAMVSDEEAMQAVSEDLRKVFGRIEGFSYRISRGFLSWEMAFANGAKQSGILSYDCLSDKFRSFQVKIVASDATTFEEIEGMLL